MIAALWLGQEQEGWVTEPMIEAVAAMLVMPSIRVLEVATFYTMFNLEPVGEHLVQVCTTTPCWLRGSDEVVEACKKHIHDKPHTVSADGKFSWMEVECLGACVNAPMLHDRQGYLRRPRRPDDREDHRGSARRQGDQAGPQNGRASSEPKAAPHADRSVAL